MNFNDLDFLPDWLVDKLQDKISKKYKDVLDEPFIFTGMSANDNNYNLYKRTNIVLYDDDNVLLVVSNTADTDISNIYYYILFKGDSKNDSFHCYYNPLIVNDMMAQHDIYVDDHYDDLLLSILGNNGTDID